MPSQKIQTFSQKGNSNLKPCKEEHSIKEVTVSIFLSEPLDAFSSFIEIGEKYFSQTFQRFEKAIKSELKILANNDSQGFLSLTLAF